MTNQSQTLELTLTFQTTPATHPQSRRKQQRNQNSKTFSYALSMRTTPCTQTNLDASWQHQAREKNIYIMVLVEIDRNYIDAEPMKSKTEGAMIKAYLISWEQLTANGTVKPTTHIMDNEASAEYKKEIQKNCTIQLVPPNNHRQNLAEQAIQTFKNHFKAVLAGIDDTFRMRLWDSFIRQLQLSNFYVNPMLYQQYQHTNMSEKILTTTKHC
jgi:hypothetical protein